MLLFHDADKAISTVSFPRVLGIEAVGTVVEAPGSDLAHGSTVGESNSGFSFPFWSQSTRDLLKSDADSETHSATAMGGMGRMFDGGYAQYTCVPANQVQKVETKLGWEDLGALPEMVQTAYGSLFKALKLKKGERLVCVFGNASLPSIN